MRAVTLFLAVTVPCLFVDVAAAQGRGRGRAEEILNRVGAYFLDVNGPPLDGDKAGDLANVDLVRAAKNAGQLAMLYVVDGSDDEDVRTQFERTMFSGDEMGITLRCFHCGRIDLKSEPTLKAKLGKQAPLFVAFDKDGKPTEILSMAGYKAQPKALETLLAKASPGVIKPSLAAFTKDYGGFVRDLEQALNKKKLLKERYAKAGSDRQKRADVDKDLAVAEKEEQKLLEQETAMLAKAGLPERPADAKRLGGRGGFGDQGGGRGGQGGGRGGQGGGQGGGGTGGGTTGGNGGG